MLLHVLVSLLLVSTMSAQTTDGDGQDVTESGPEANETLLVSPATIGEQAEQLRDRLPLDIIQMAQGMNLAEEARKAFSEDESTTASAEGEKDLREHRIRAFFHLLRKFRFVRGAIVLVFRTRGDYRDARFVFFLFRPSKVVCYKGDCIGNIGPFKIILSVNYNYRGNPSLTFVTDFIIFRFRFVERRRRRDPKKATVMF